MNCNINDSTFLSLLLKRLPIYAQRHFYGTEANNSADPDLTPQKAVSDQGLYCLLTERSIKV